MAFLEVPKMRDEDQLFIFSEDVKKVKSYFSALYNNNNYKEHLEIKFFDYDELSHKIAVLTHNTKNYELIKQMLQTDEALRVVTALLFKGFSWNNELLEHFSIDSNLYVNKTLATLRTLNLLKTIDGVSLHPILYDTIKKSKGGQIRRSLHQAKIYFITPEYVNFCKTLTPLFEFKVKTSLNFNSTLELIFKHSLIFEKNYNLILEQETKHNFRREKTEEGILYETETLRNKQLKSEISQAVKEVKLELLEEKEKQNLLNDVEKYQLQVIRNDKNNLAILSPKTEEKKQIEEFKRTGKSTTTYNGKLINEDKLLKDLEEQDQEIQKAPLVVGDESFILPSDEFNEVKVKGLYLSPSAIREYQEVFKPKTDEEKVNDFFNALKIGSVAK